jgi:hypothetical protein
MNLGEIKKDEWEKADPKPLFEINPLTKNQPIKKDEKATSGSVPPAANTDAVV